MSTDFEQLLREMRRCSICEGLELGPKPIFKLSGNARILIAGQAPGRLAHQRGLPFDDPSGDRLRAWLGVDRNTFYNDDRIAIFPMGLCFPGTGKSGDMPPRPECAPAWRDRVLDRLKQLCLTVVIGRYAIDWHLPPLSRKSVADAVRQAAGPDTATIVLPHPSPRNIRWFRNNPWFEREIVPQLQSRVARALFYAVTGSGSGGGLR